MMTRNHYRLGHRNSVRKWARKFLPRITALESRDVPTAFTPGDIVVTRTGDGSNGANTSITVPIFLDEFTPAGGFVQSFNITSLAPGSTAGNQLISSDLTNGSRVVQLSRSFDGSALLFGGIDTSINQPGGNGSATSYADRVLARVGIDPNAPGGINTTTHGQMFSTDDIRAVVQYDATHIYGAGHQDGSNNFGGIRYFSGLSASFNSGLQTSTSAQLNPSGATVGFDGRLYWTTAKNAGVYTQTPQLPTTAQPSDIELIPNGSGSEKLGSVFLADVNGDGLLDDGDRFYYTGLTSDLQVSTYNGTTRKWSTPIQLAKPTGDNLIGLTGQVVGGNVVLYATSYDQNKANNSYLVTYTDVDGKTPGSFTTLATLPETGLQGYRGVALAPVNPTTVTITNSAATALPTDMVTFNATLTSANGLPTGSVNFIDFVGAAADIDTYGVDHGHIIGSAAIDAMGHASISVNLPLGSNNVRAFYAGTTTITTGSSGFVNTLVTGPNMSTTTIVSAPNFSTFGQTVTFTANVSGLVGAPTGTVTFLDGATLLGTAPVDMVSGNATIGLSSLSVGSHTITANYGGDANYKVSTSNTPVVQAVHGGASVVVTTSLNAARPFAPITITAAVSGNGTDGAPNGGMVTFYSDGMSIGSGAIDGMGHATMTTSSLTAGSHFLTATYGGDAIYGKVTSPSYLENVKQAFAPGDLLVVRLGDGIVGLSSDAAQVFVDEYTPAGKLVQSVAMPNVDSGTSHILTLSGSAATSGVLTMSADGHYVTLTGIDAAPGTGVVTQTDPSVTPRVVAKLDINSNLDTSTALLMPNASSFGSVLGAVTKDGKEFWIGGDANGASSSGLQYAKLGSVGNPTPVGPAGVSGRSPTIYNGQLYLSSTDIPEGVGQVGTGLPTSATTVTGLPGGITIGNPMSYQFFDHTGLGGAPDLLYVADLSGGLLKYYYDGTNWIFIGEKFDFAGGATGLTGFRDPATGNFVLYGTGNKSARGAAATTLFTFTDTNPYNANFSLGNVTEMVNVNALGEAFRGVAFVPKPFFTPGDIVVTRTGDGSNGANTSVTVPIFIDEYTPAGTLVQSINVSALAPGNTAGNQLISSDLTNGSRVVQLSRSFDGSALLFGGIDTSINQPGGNGSATSYADRVLASIGIDPNAPGGINTTTHGQMYSTDDIRAVVEYDATHIYGAGHQDGSNNFGGVRYFSGLSASFNSGLQTSTSAQLNPAGATVGFDGRLYWTTAKNAGVYTQTPQLPTTAQPSDIELIPNGSGSEKLGSVYLADVNGDGLLDDGDRMYYTGLTSDLQVSTYNGTTRKWSTPIQLAKPIGDNLIGLTGQVVGGNVVLYATSYDQNKANNSYLVTYTDVDGKTPGSFTTLATLPETGLQGYRGVAFTPVNPTTVTITTSTANALPTDTVTFNATVSSLNGLATGSVTFIDFAGAAADIDSYGVDHGRILGTGAIDAMGHASFSTTLPLGSNNVRAFYAGAATVTTGSSGFVNTLVTGPNMSTTTIVSAPNFSTFGQTVTFTANVSGIVGAPTGTVTFLDGAILLGTAPVDMVTGNATVSLSNLSVGSHTITANYGGDANYKISTSVPPVIQVVHNGASVVVTTSQNPVAPATPITITATVTGNGTDGAPIGGTLNFYSDGKSIGSGGAIDAMGHATISATLSAGSHFLTATYGGDAVYGMVTSPSYLENVKQAFAPGDLLVVRLGDGIVGLSSDAAQVFVDEYTPAGTLVQSVAMPNVDAGYNHILTLSGSAATSGVLTVSADGHYVTLTGIDAAPGTGVVTQTDPSVTARVVARLDSNSNLDTSTALLMPNASSFGSVLGAVSKDGQEFWIGGDANGAASSGLQYAKLGTVGNPTPVGPAGVSGRSPTIYNGQLYLSSTDIPEGIGTVGVGLPTSSTTLTGLPGGITISNAMSYKFFDHTGGNGAPDLLYVADLSGGLLKYYYDGTNWIFIGEKFDFAGGTTGLTGFRDPASGNFVLYGTGNKSARGAAATTLFMFTDTNPYNANFSLGNVNELVNVNALGEAFRGVAFVPTPLPTTPPKVLSTIVNNGDIQRSRVTNIKVTFDSHVTLPAVPASAFHLFRQSDNAVPTLSVAIDDSGAGTVVTLTFTGTTSVDHGSLADGRYTLDVLQTQVFGPGGNLDGNGDGVPGDDYTLIGSPGTSPNLFRFFGDITGDGTVSAADFNGTGPTGSPPNVIGFRQAFGGSYDPFDFDGDGAVAASDFIQFRLRFGGSI
jgi:hypothetical protein